MFNKKSGCQRFAPKYSALAERTHKTNPEIKFYAVSCYPLKYICNQMGTVMYPEVRLIRAESTEIVKFDITPAVDGNSTIMEEINKLDQEQMVTKEYDMHAITPSTKEYLYMDQAGGSHVIELQKKDLPAEGSNNTLPDFLVSSTHGDRFVVFYSHNCG